MRSRPRPKKAFPGGQAPVGYRRTQDGTLRVVPREASLVRTLFREYARQGSLGRLGRHLAERRVLNHGRPWSRQGLAWILRNPVYRGDLRSGSDLAPGACPRIVPADLFARVQELLTVRCRNPRRVSRAFGVPQKRRAHEPPLAVQAAAQGSAQPR